MTVQSRIIISFTLCVFFAIFIAFALDYAPEARLMPLTVGIPALLLSLLQLCQDIFPANDAGREDPSSNDKKQILIMLGWFAGLVLATVMFGVLPAGWLFIFTFLRYQHRQSLWYALIIATSFILLIHLLFEVLLNVELLQGLIFAWSGIVNLSLAA